MIFLVLDRHQCADSRDYLSALLLTPKISVKSSLLGFRDVSDFEENDEMGL